MSWRRSDHAKPPSALAAALRLLGRREHSRQELREKLLRKSIPAEEVEAALERLAQEDLQNDQRFANSSVRMKASAGQGPVLIRAALSQHGLGDGVAQEAMNEAGVDWVAQARQILLRRYGQGKLDFKTRNKALTFLMRRGFTLDDARTAMDSRLQDDA